jgi:selenocysteine-specific elongation factor
LSFKRGEIESVLSYLLNKRSLVKLKEGKFLLSSAVEQAREKLEGALAALANNLAQGESSQGITVSEYRDILGTGRKMAIEILEYFDRELVTVRRGDFRVIRSAGSKGRDNIKDSTRAH